MKKAQKTQKAQKAEPQSKTVLQHIKEFRGYLFLSLGFFVLFTVIAFLHIEEVMKMLLNLGEAAGYSFISISPQEIVVQELRISGFVGFFLSLPVILFSVTSYISEAKFLQKIVIMFGVFIITALFFAGMAFAYFIMFPIMLEFLYNSGLSFGFENMAITIEKYLSLFLSVMTIFGFITEMPAITVFLSKIGIVSPKLLKEGFGYAVIVISVMAALVTPTDLMSMFLVAGPTIMIYVFCIFISRIFFKKKKSDFDN